MRITFILLALLFSCLCHGFEIDEIREFPSDRYSDYSEIEEIQQNIMLSFYSIGKKNLPPSFPYFAEASLVFMNRFGEAHELSSSGSTDDLLILPERVNVLSSSLRSMEALEKDEVPLSKHTTYLARSLLKAYVSDQANKLQNLAESEARTKRKLEYYKAGSELFEYSENKIRAAEMKVTYDSIKAVYDLDMNTADTLLAQASKKCSDSMLKSNELFGLSTYAGLRECKGNLLEARNTYVSHLENEKLHQVDSQVSIADNEMQNLSGGLMGFFLVGSFLFISFNITLIWRLRKWYDDSYDVSLGSEVLRWKKRY